MQLEIHGTNIWLGRDFREHVERRLLFALGRRERQIQRVIVFVGDVNGPRSGPDKLCKILIRLRRSGKVIAESLDVSLEAAVDQAVERAGQAVTRRLERHRTRRSRRPEAANTEVTS